VNVLIVLTTNSNPPLKYLTASPSITPADLWQNKNKKPSATTNKEEQEKSVYLPANL
jgi:hypothetical protein